MVANLKDSNLDLTKVRLVSKKRGDFIKNEAIRDGLKISITNDAMFKMMFLREEYIKFPCKLLSYIIDYTYEEILTSAYFTKNETGKESKKAYEYRNDLVLDMKDSKIIIEMNNNSSEKIRNRNVSYMLRVREDRKVKDEYCQTILINLNNYCYRDNNKVRRDFAFLDQDGYLYTDNLVIVDIYLPNIIKKCYTDGIEHLSEMERFLLLGITQDYQSALKYVGDDMLMQEFVEESMERSNDEGLLRAYDHAKADMEEFVEREVAERLEQEIEKIRKQEIEKIRKQELKQGVKYGIQQGKKENSIELAKSFFDKGIDIRIISEVTGFSVEKIKNL